MFIYLIRNLINYKVYIGKFEGKKLAWRWNMHIKSANKGLKCALHRAIRKYGKENFEIIPLIDNINDKLKLIEMEKFCILLFNSKINGYNMTDGGDGLLNPSLETRKKIGRIHKGKIISLETKTILSQKAKLRPPNRLGTKLSKESKDKISKSQIGRIPWNKGIKGVKKAWNKGKSFSAESKLKMSNSHKKLQMIRNQNGQYIGYAKS